MESERETHVPSDEYRIRLAKVERLRELGIEPWPACELVTGTCAQVAQEFTEDVERKYTIAGRIMTMRDHGKTFFVHIQDVSGRLQLYFKQDVLGEQQWTFFKDFIDTGDIIWCTGIAFKTHKGEITVRVESFKLLSKCLHALPEKFHGIADQEIKYRQRYLDLISSVQTRERFLTRSKIITKLRTFLDDKGFVEVETPMLHAIPGGASARPFITHHNALDSDFYLRIAPELHLKRLGVGGFERVYELNRNFRNEGVSVKHNPEYTSLEYYMAHHDYRFAMTFLETMLRDVVLSATGSLQVQFGENNIDFEKPFAKMSVYDAVKTVGGCSDAQLAASGIDATLREHGATLENKQPSYGEKLFALFDHLAEHKLIQPTFVFDYPIEISPLAKRDPNNLTIAARFELFVGGFELANGFNELNDPIDQAERFKQQVAMRERGDTEAQYYDADYVLSLEYGLPPTVGVGMGIDRLTMLLTNTTSIKEVILFPTLKKKPEEL